MREDHWEELWVCWSVLPPTPSPRLQHLGPEKVFPRICLPLFMAKFGWTCWCEILQWGVKTPQTTKHINRIFREMSQDYLSIPFLSLRTIFSNSLIGSFGKGSLRKLCHSTLVYQSFLTATVIAALHCISSCHNQSSIESVWNDCSWLQVGRQCNHSIGTLQLSTTTHSAAHNDPPPTHCKLHFEKLWKFCGNFCGIFSKNRFYCTRKFCGNFAEI